MAEADIDCQRHRRSLAALPALVFRFKIRFKSEQIVIARRNQYDARAGGSARFKHRVDVYSYVYHWNRMFENLGHETGTYLHYT